MKILKNYWYVLIIIILFISAFFIDIDNDIDVSSELIEEEKIYEEINIDEVITKYYVDIKGEVVNPGVYEVESGNRVIDVINMAGGLTKNADTSLINLSKKVKDEMNIKIYSKKEIEEAYNPTIIIKEIEKECECPIPEQCDRVNDALIEYSEIEVVDSNVIEETIIDINTATKEELMSIPGIGESKANNIIEYRNTTKFETIEDIMNVSGIGQSVYEKVKDYIKV